jgi:hypothetical protein
MRTLNKGEIMEELETVSLWNKKADELTVGDSVKFAVGVTVVTTAATFAVMAGVAGLVRLSEKLAERKAAKKPEVTT